MGPISWSDVLALTGPLPKLPPEFSNRDNAYETWILKARMPRSGCSTFWMSLVCSPLYTERPIGVKRSSGGALGLTPGNAQGDVLPGTIVDLNEQAALKSPEEVNPFDAKSAIVAGLGVYPVWSG